MIHDNQNNRIICADNDDVRDRLCDRKGRKMTNREKFEDVYGFEPDQRLCVAPQMVCDSQHGNCFKCPFNKFWEKEYRECFKIRKEYAG